MKKKAIAIVLICLVVALSAVAIILNVTHPATSEIISKPSIIYIYNSDTESNPNGFGAYKVERRNTQRIDDIYSKFEVPFGSESGLHSVDNRQAGIVNSISNLYSDSEYTVVFYYSQEQEMNVGDQTIKYQYLFFKVKNESGKNTVVFGVNSKAQDGESTSTKALNLEDSSEKRNYLPYYYSYEAKINFGGLYNYLSEMNLSK